MGPDQGPAPAHAGRRQRADARLAERGDAGWDELEYNPTLHSEIGTSPLKRFLHDRSVGLASPSAEALRRAFRQTLVRTQRRSDGTISLWGRRFEVPARFRHLEKLSVRCARWDLSSAELIKPRSRTSLARLWPLDKKPNADGRRRDPAGWNGFGRLDRAVSRVYSPNFC